MCRGYKPCEFLEFVWTNCWGNPTWHFYGKYNYQLSMSVKGSLGERWDRSISWAGRRMKWDTTSFTEGIYSNLHVNLTRLIFVLYHSYINSLILKHFLLSFIHKTFLFAVKYILTALPRPGNIDKLGISLQGNFWFGGKLFYAKYTHKK